MNRKNKCENKAAALALELQIKEKDLQIKEKDLQILKENRLILKEKNKSKELENKGKLIDLKVAKHSSVNINFGDMNFGDMNITNNFCNMIKPEDVRFTETIGQSRDLIDKTNFVKTIENSVRHIFNNDAFPERKCLFSNNGKIYGKVDDKVVMFKEVRLDFNQIVIQLFHYMKFEYAKFTEHEMSIGSGNQKPEYIPDDEIKSIEKSGDFIANPKNNGYVDKITIKGISDT